MYAKNLNIIAEPYLFFGRSQEVARSPPFGSTREWIKIEQL
jgi:hypothetical protein